jgi:ArsR family transcriptional regulator
MEELADLLKAMAHPTRLQILNILRRGEICVCHIENALGKRQAYISQQLMVLRDAGVVESRRDGLQVYYRIVDPRVSPLLDASLGEMDSAEFMPLPDCSCPACTTIALTSVH